MKIHIAIIAACVGTLAFAQAGWAHASYGLGMGEGPVAGLVGIEGGVVSGVFNLESPDVSASGRRPRHEDRYHDA